jgi:hypothetical protein
MTTDDKGLPDWKKKPLYEHPDDARRRLYEWHKRAGTLGYYYYMYPEDRLSDHEPEPTPTRSRGR